MLRCLYMFIFFKTYHLIILGLFFFGSEVAYANTFQNQKPENNITYPKTYTEAIEEMVLKLNDDEKILLRDFPKYELRKLRYLFVKYPFINFKDYYFLKSCAHNIGEISIHFEDAPIVILEGIWGKLNQDLELIDFYNIEPESYFETIQSIIKKGKKNNRNGYFSSLPIWINEIFPGYYYTKDSIRDLAILKIAKNLIYSKNRKSHLGLLYIMNYNSDRFENKELIDLFYKNKSEYIELPSHKYLYDENKNIIKTEYFINKISCHDLAIKCFNILYQKNFNSENDYEDFLKFCDTNYLAKWKYQQELKINDYNLLINEPKKLLEILILSKNYFGIPTGKHHLIYSSYDSSKELVHFFELNNKKIDVEFPYHESLKEEYDEIHGDLYGKEIGALTEIVNQLSMEELFEILDPKTTTNYNNSIKTTDFLDYKYLTSFIISTQYQRLLSYSDKEQILDLITYYSNNEFVSWGYKYYLFELLIQIDKEKFLNNFKSYFQKNPEEGSFTRQGILKSIIKYDFENNIKFIEDWYWTVQNKNFRTRPFEHKLILDLLINKNTDESIKLHNIIKNDFRYKD